MEHAIYAAFLSVGILSGILICLELAFRRAVRRLERTEPSDDPDPQLPALNTIDGAIFGLMGLILAFTFSGALQRWDERRDFVIQETNAIGTAWLRIDLLPAIEQPALRDLLRGYLDHRLEFYRSGPDWDAMMAAYARATETQTRIWSLAMASDRGQQTTSAAMLLPPALNDMFDIATIRTAGFEMHPPKIVYVLLFVLILASSLITGDAMGRSRTRPWAHVLAFAFVLGATVYIVIDLEYPRLGLFRIDDIDHWLVSLRESMK